MVHALSRHSCCLSIPQGAIQPRGPILRLQATDSNRTPQHAKCICIQQKLPTCCTAGQGSLGPCDRTAGSQGTWAACTAGLLAQHVASRSRCRHQHSVLSRGRPMKEGAGQGQSVAGILQSYMHGPACSQPQLVHASAQRPVSWPTCLAVSRARQQ